MYQYNVHDEIVKGLIKNLGGVVKTHKTVLMPWFDRILKTAGLEWDWFRFIHSTSKLTDSDQLFNVNGYIISGNDVTPVLNENELKILKEIFPFYPTVGCNLGHVSEKYRLSLADFDNKEGLFGLYPIAMVMRSSPKFRVGFGDMDLRAVASEFGRFINTGLGEQFISTRGYCDDDTIACLHVLHDLGVLVMEDEGCRVNLETVDLKRFASHLTGFAIVALRLQAEFADDYMASIDHMVECYRHDTGVSLAKPYKRGAGNKRDFSEALTIYTAAKNINNEQIDNERHDAIVKLIQGFTFDNIDLFLKTNIKNTTQGFCELFSDNTQKYVTDMLFKNIRL